MRKFIKFSDDETVELTPISYNEFMAINQWSGSSDMAYDEWLRMNGYKEVSWYNEDALEDALFFVTLEPISQDRFQFKLDPEGPSGPYDSSKTKIDPWDKYLVTRYLKSEKIPPLD